MKKKYSVEEILRILSEEKQTGKTIRGICREHNITEQALSLIHIYNATCIGIYNIFLRF